MFVFDGEAVGVDEVVVDVVEEVVAFEIVSICFGHYFVLPVGVSLGEFLFDVDYFLFEPVSGCLSAVGVEVEFVFEVDGLGEFAEGGVVVDGGFVVVVPLVGCFRFSNVRFAGLISAVVAFFDPGGFV